MTNCLAVALPSSRGLAAYHIVGRLKRHGTARHVAMKHSIAELHGCGHPPGKLATLARKMARAPASVAMKSVPALAAVASLAAGSGVIGGFGRMGVFGSVGACGGATCHKAVSLQEPFSAGLLASVALFLMVARVRQIQKNKSFLVLFSKKELLSSLPSFTPPTPPR
jgi:hypothetical protein